MRAGLENVAHHSLLSKLEVTFKIVSARHSADWARVNDDHLRNQYSYLANRYHEAEGRIQSAYSHLKLAWNVAHARRKRS
jgi:hypothetical protein